MPSVCLGGGGAVRLPLSPLSSSNPASCSGGGQSLLASGLSDGVGREDGTHLPLASGQVVAVIENRAKEVTPELVGREYNISQETASTFLGSSLTQSAAFAGGNGNY